MNENNPTNQSHDHDRTTRTRGMPLFKETDVSKTDLNQINAIALRPLKEKEIYTRSMYLCSSQPCLADGCQFTRRALEQVASLIVGQSVLTGHDRTSLPIARFYKAEVVDRGVDEDGKAISFVRAWFYWLSETKGAKDLLLNIDGGIYREVSLAWRYRNWSCSICGAKNSTCGHRIGDIIDNKRCFRLIDEIMEVLEGSLVYKGADKKTVLIGNRGQDITQLAEPMLIVCEETDPILNQLATVLTERKPLAEYEGLLAEGIGQLWIRMPKGETADAMALSLLADDGLCVVEERHDSEEEDLLGCDITLLQRDADALLPLPLESKEAHDATVW
ncbi:hypothetical protein GF373_07300 [bacterium]|nr:hypothetical protein [bacterium]